MLICAGPMAMPPCTVPYSSPCTPCTTAARGAVEARHAARAGVSSSFDAAQREIARLRGVVSETAARQAAAADVLDEVSSAVKDSGARLEALGLQSSDVVAALARSEVRGEALGRAMLATQVFLTQVRAAGPSLHSFIFLTHPKILSLQRLSAVLAKLRARWNAAIAMPAGRP